MFLNRLKQEEKLEFLKLAHYVARVDGKFVNQEELTIFTYCKEMKISDIDFDESKYNMEASMSIVKSKRTKKIIILEILALIYSDELFHPKEKEVVGKLSEIFNIDPNLLIIYGQWAKNAISIQLQGEALINL